MSPRYTSLIQSLPVTVPFTGPEALERASGKPFAARLGANELGFGPSPRAIAAMQAAVCDLWMYGDPEGYDLRAAIAAHHGVGLANVVVGEGIDGVLAILMRLIVAEGDCVVTTHGAYPTFNFHVIGAGGRVETVPYHGVYEDPAALVQAAHRHGAKAVYLVNPDNPMGSWHGQVLLHELLEALPEGCLLVLDEAYVELAPEGTALEVRADDPRVIHMRTFSKAYGLAGLRVAYALAAPELIAAFDKIRNHFGVGRLAQSGALAALQDQDWVTKMRAEISASKAEIAAIGAAHGMGHVPSATNFLCLDTGRDGAYSAALVSALATEGVFIRKPSVAPLDRHIRISCGPAREMAVLREALPKALARL